MTTDADFEVVETKEGSRAMFDRSVGEVMHPVIGPNREAEALYVGPSRLRERLSEANEAPLVLLDVGLGAGSNAICAWHVSEALAPTQRKLEIVSFERTLRPLELALADENRAAFNLEAGASEAASALLREHRHHGARTHWRLCLGDVQEQLAQEPENSADIVFWDMYSSRVNPSLWGYKAFSAARRVCREGATLHTYSGATSTRSALLLAGFYVGFGKAVGNKQKRTTLATTRLEDLAEPLDARWLQSLGSSSASLPEDAPEDPLQRLKAHPQFAPTLPA